MCLAIHSDGHLGIKCIYEQNWPKLQNGRIEFLECYDIILRNYSPSSLKHLYILSPNKVRVRSKPHDLFKLQHYEETTMCNWALDVKQEEAGEIRKIRITGCSDEPPIEFEAVLLRPKLEVPSWMNEYPNAAYVFYGTEMTTAVLTFEDGQELKTFDPNKPSHTTYWLRIAFYPDINYHVKQPIEFGEKTRLLSVQPCLGYGPGVIVDRANDRLMALRNSQYEQDALQAKKSLLTEVFNKFDSSTRIEDYRISLVTDKKFLVLNPHVEGSCGFVGVEPIDSKRIARTWFTGARHFPETDPLTLVRNVYSYMKSWAYNEADAKTKEDISAAVAPSSHDNVSHIVEALVKLSFVKDTGSGCYYIQRPLVEDGTLFLQQPVGANEMNLGKRDSEVRNLLFGDVNIPGQPGRVSRFKPRSFRIHFDLVFV